MNEEVITRNVPEDEFQNDDTNEGNGSSSLLEEAGHLADESETFIPASVFSFNYKLFRSLVLILGQLSTSMYLEMTGPSLQELMFRVGSNYEQMGRYLLCRAVGYFIASLVAAILADIFSKHIEILLVFSYVFGAVGTAWSPWCIDLNPLLLLNTLQGLAAGIADTGHNLLILRLWAQKAAAPMAILHLGFGAGALIATQLVKPFLVEHTSHIKITNRSVTIVSMDYENISGIPAFETEDSINENMTSTIEIPYAIAAVHTLIYAFINIAIYCYELRKYSNSATSSQAKTNSISPWKRLKKGLSMFSPAACTEGDIMFGLLFFVLLFVYFANLVGLERVIGKFLFSFARDSSLSFTNNQAANLNSAYWLTFVVGRLLAVFLSLLLSAKNFMLILLSILVTSSVFLMIYGHREPLALWILMVAFGASIGPLFPTCASLANLYVEMRGIAVGIMLVGAATGAMVYQYVTGYLFQLIGPLVFTQILMACTFIIAVDFILLLLVAKRHGKRFQPVVVEVAGKETTASHEE